MKITTTLSLSFLLSASYLPAAMAQTVNGTLGQPSATITLDGKQLPAPPPKFGGVIKENAKDSKPWWPPTVVPPKGAPNVLLIMTDDQGYGVSGTFGGVIPTPALDRIAKAGLRYTQFCSTALCSPTRAALITGRNHHSVGNGVISELSTGFPGYDSVIGTDNATIGAILKGNGYATSWFGKNHNTPAYQYTVAGPFDQWPSGMGFDYFYGFMGGETDQWTPYLFQNNKQIFPWVGKPGYNLTTDMADEAISYMKELNAAAPDKPFFLYYVPGGSHSPHQPKAEWVEKFKGKFDMGWNAMRDQIFANQKRLGVIPDNAKLTDWPDSLPKWDGLSADQKKLYARQAEVYAGYTAYTDNEIGRVIQAVEDMGQLDNTLPRSKADRLVLTERLVEAGLTLIREAEMFGKTALARAAGVRNGLLIVLLALHPIRVKNFVTLTIADTFINVDGRWWLHIPSEDTKSHRMDERQVPEFVTNVVNSYIETHRPVLCRGREHPALWVSSITGGQLTTKNLGTLISKLTRETIGVDVSPHLFRTVAASTAAVYGDSQPHLASALLNHRDTRVTEDHYNRASSISAGQEYARITRFYRQS